MRPAMSPQSSIVFQRAADRTRPDQLGGGEAFDAAPKVGDVEGRESVELGLDLGEAAAKSLPLDQLA